ncbi:hypothetical protein Cylst_3280 [Cylindrospermum stagnale PCC 7417]|uniref:Uncharacterized protein n=1 Tax=Cylindrospermum stagnale PCC 7417 TaxID=56107 RepID=K9WYI9_9NOST|nr:hypothetical protein [Cylindrospermum stagnale]AFZ25435.1 hypothetical protein Cylst_3280 [Cylindrospermum stagnale PCC 7417]
MTDEIDQLLADWKNKINIASHNLLELQELPTYQRLCGSPGFPGVQLTGITAIRVSPAISAMNDLFQYFDLLVQTIDQASKLRQQLPRFLVPEQKVDEIKQLLTGASIRLPAVQTPLAQRELLTIAQTAQAIAPAQLLQVMNHAFSVARDAVLAVDAAWANLDGMLKDAVAQIQSLEKLGESLGQSSLSEILLIRGTIASLQQRIEQDPLGVSEDFQHQIQPMLAQLQSTLAQAAKQLAQARDKLAIAQETLQQLEKLHSKSVATFAESQEKIVDHSIMQTPLPQAQIDALSQWLTKLETKLAQGLVNPVMVGLDNWLLKAREYMVTAQRTDTAHNNLLQTRRELRGRLDALKAKALVRRLIEDAILAELAQQAKELLYMRPTPLDKAAELVSQYEKRLNGNR